MEGGSEGENPNKIESSSNNNNNNNNMSNNGGNKVNNSNEGQSKPKRQMKTPFQLETLEKAYTLDAYPSESIRAELSEKLGLSDRQLQMWFCHRRLKDKKDGGPTKKARKTVPMPESPVNEPMPVAEPGSDYGSGSGSGSGSSPFGPAELRNVVSRGLVDDLPMGRGYHEQPPRQSIMERTIAIVEAQLGEPLREDGPVLGIEFDPLPPDAFGAPIGLVGEHQKRSGSRFEPKSYERHDVKPNKATQRALQEYPFLSDPSSARNDTYGLVAPSHVHNSTLHGTQGHASRVRILTQQDKQGVALSSLPLDAKDPFPTIRASPQVSEHPIISPENPYVLSDGQVFSNDSMLRMEKKRKNEEARIAREVEAHELRIRKEMEKQDILRRKHEERIRKETERQDRERRKEEERLIREKQREEERSKREQRREMERREKFLQKEHLRLEKRKLKEELRKEKEAVRRKAAIEKATARRIARESMELIEDEQLELMEMAAAQKGLHSIISLDHDTMQILESFRDFLGAFPPKSVQLKRPFAIQPWNNSEENIGNLLMVWRFLITFADILQLWPFTLDEFVQAFHDYDSRLLGEIHVSLLKLIIKDIEDVARTPLSGLGLNQNGMANPGGGHPEIVEGAYTWGFDIRNWQRLLNPLTWPEVFRQLALSAGFGPQLKKRSLALSYLPDNEGKICEDVISNLRSGSAAENAFAIMQEKGLLAPRKSRHRLTPGTVKFAAFHVLSLEGNKGLTVLELADKIQKSGLRDLTTSKTPEASISVALTRDAKLFERIAPSTYRVRSAYRKDPADAEAILSAARKKVQVFENGFLAAEDADEVERDEDSECDDVDEDPEVEDLATPSRANILPEHYNEVNTCSGTGKENFCNDIALDVKNEFDKDCSSVPLSGSKIASSPVANSEQQFASVENTSCRNPEEENMEIDESKSGESWIHGLTEGEYSDLSVEERLNALVALIGIANEGNSIRVVLEDRLEAANSLKKQMWAEAQLDKSRLKEESMTRLDFPSAMGGKTEVHFARSAGEGSQSPLPDIGIRNSDMSPSTAENKKPVHDLNIVQPDLNSLPTERTPVALELSAGPDNFLTQHLAFASKRSRSQLKSYIAHRAEEMYVYRSLPLGQDRRRNRYWQFVASASKNDPGSGRIFVELQDGNWRLIDTEEAFDSLLMSLDTRGIRESHLRLMLQKIEAAFKENVRRRQFPTTTDRGVMVAKRDSDEIKRSPGFQAIFDSPSSTICGSSSDVELMETSLSFGIELSRNEVEKKASLRRYQDFQKWMWKECFNSSTLRAMKYGEKRCSELLDICDICLASYSYEETHCFSCHQTFGQTGNDFKASQHEIQCKERRKSNPGNIHVLDSGLPFGSRLLKALLALVEASVPPESLQSFWSQDRRETWGLKLNASLSSEQLLQVLTLFESVIKRDFLTSSFSATKELLGSSSSNQSGLTLLDHSDLGSVPILPWVPHNSAAVAFRLFELDASITYIPEEKSDPADDKGSADYMKLPTRFGRPRNDKEIQATEADYSNYMRDENLSQLKGSRSYRRRRGSREQVRAKKLQRKVNGSRSTAARRNAKVTADAPPGFRQPGRALKQAGGRGRRTVRKRRTENNKMVDETLQVHMAEIPSSPESRGESPRNLEEEWDDDNVVQDHIRDDENIAGEEEEEEEEEDEEEEDEEEEEEEEEEVAEFDDNPQEEEYQLGNWEVGFNGVSDKWNRGALMEASDEEEVRDVDSEGEIDGSEESDGIPNRVENQGSDSSASDDYSD